MYKLAAVVVLLCLCFAASSAWAQAEGASSAAASNEVGLAAAGSAAMGATAGTSTNSQGDSPGDTRRVDGPEKNSNEWLVWAAGAIPFTAFHSAPLAHIWSAGGTYGRVFTAAHGPGILRGRFEAAFEIDPLIEIELPHRPVYAAGFTPVVWKWDLVTRRRLSPYLQFSGGGLWGNHQVVAGTTTFNFMPSIGGGLNFPASRSGKYSWTADVRFFHISNAGITQYNPGLNTIQVRVGFGIFTHPKPRPAV
jgi:lipid A 3-O-deacylase